METRSEVRRAVSHSVEVLMLISVGIVGSGMFYSYFGGSVAGSRPPATQAVVVAASAIQAPNEPGVLSLQVENSGLTRITSFNLQLSGLEPVGGTPSPATYQIRDYTTGTLLTAGSFTPASPIASASITATINPSQVISVVLTFQATSSGSQYFVAGHKYGLLLSTTPSSLTATSVVFQGG